MPRFTEPGPTDVEEARARRDPVTWRYLADMAVALITVTGFGLMTAHIIIAALTGGAAP